MEQSGYVSGHNIYVEDLASGDIKKLTDGTTGLKNLSMVHLTGCMKKNFFAGIGFSLESDGKTIAYWQIDANQIRETTICLTQPIQCTARVILLNTLK
jgi:dipeptidyl-peptidase-4